MDGLPTMPGMSPLPGTPPIPQMPNLSSSFLPQLNAPAAVPNAPPQTPQPPQLQGTSPLPAPPGVPSLPPAGAGFMGALRSGLPGMFSGSSTATPGAGSAPSWMSGLMGRLGHEQAMGDWQNKLAGGAGGVLKGLFGGGMTPGSGVSGYLSNLGNDAKAFGNTVLSRPAPSATALSGPFGGMLGHVFDPYTAPNNGGSNSTT